MLFEESSFGIPLTINWRWVVNVVSDIKKIRNTRDGVFGRDEWIIAAKKTLLKSGIEEVKVDQIALKIKMSRGSFYHHFSSRADLLTALLDHWQATNNAPILRAIEKAIETFRGEDASIASLHGG